MGKIDLHELDLNWPKLIALGGIDWNHETTPQRAFVLCSCSTADEEIAGVPNLDFGP